MPNRKKLIEEIVADFHAMRNKMQAKITLPHDKDCITSAQLFVLAIVEQCQNIGIKEIAKKLNISPSAATQLVDVLANNGYVMRKENSKDRRALELRLSKKGRKHITDLKNKRIQIMSCLFDALSDKELQTYLKLHKKILSKISK